MTRTHAARKRKSEAPVGGAAEPQRRGAFTNSAGQVIELQGLSPWLIESLPLGLEREWAAAGREKPAPPTYTVETAGGEPEVHEHDETTLATDEDRAAWASYLVAKAEWEAALKDRLIRVVFLEGVRTRPASDDWVKRQQFLGLAVPDDPLEREVHYVKTVLVRTPEDAEGILTAVMALSGVDEEAIRAAEASFRDSMARPGRDAAGVAGG